MYAGYLNSEAYGLTWQKMKHEPLISLETHQKIQERRAGVAKAPKRANIGDQFVLRGIVDCTCCGTPVRSYFTTGRHGGKFPYHMCGKKGCQEYGKSTKRGALEDQVGELIKDVQPTPDLIALAAEMFKRAWNARTSQADELRDAAWAQAERVEKEINALVDRVMSATNATVIARYKDKIAELEGRKVLLTEKAQKDALPSKSFQEAIEPCFKSSQTPRNYGLAARSRPAVAYSKSRLPSVCNTAEMGALEPRP